MKLLELESTANNSLVLFVDLDGVLADFHSKALEVTGMDATIVDSNPATKKEFWRKIKQHLKSGEKFWEAMVPLRDAHVLWRFVSKYSPTILTSTGSEKSAQVEKEVWVKHHIGDVPVIFVRDSADKAQYAAPNHILIDDRLKSINPWIAAGGIGILHISAEITITRLKALGL